MARFDFCDMADVVRFYYLKDGDWVQAGEPRPLACRLDHFVGCHVATYAYSTPAPGGSAVFSDFRYRVPGRPEEGAPRSGV